MSETYGYRVGAVQSMTTFMPVGDGTLYDIGLIKRWVKGRNRIFKYHNVPKFAPPLVKAALNQVKKDYPDQKFHFGTFKQDNRVFLAIRPEHPTPPDQWMIVAPVVEE